MLSKHSLHGLPLLDSPSIVPDITSFTNLLSFILHTCPNKFSFSFHDLLYGALTATLSYAHFIIRDFLLPSYSQYPSVTLHFKSYSNLSLSRLISEFLNITQV